ncbi:hypothetical protein IHQ68_07670 [Chelatococcus sambhunathii]|uniref:DUF5666 domain-containing protein n=1 Tax=Chelatococcus sambhunathii TaxID=363953 RepID=A0ABU1DEG3_9HYPH|nr:hypothetical protein [Chelatococcus sambhunathii]MDR4306492.1 hypothetical protein [Chelatococcus sambhunathii]
MGVDVMESAGRKHKSLLATDRVHVEDCEQTMRGTTMHMPTTVKTAALGFAAMALAAGPALAVTVQNPTDKALEVVADLGATEPKVTVEPGKSAKLDCPEGCEVRAIGLNSYGVSAKTGDKLTVKDGALAYADGAAGEKGKTKTQ